MCYRTSVPGREVLEQRFSAQFAENTKFERKYHVSSFTLPELPIISDDHPRQIQLFQWGLIPSWVKDEENANEIRLKTMNARAESLFEKPSYRYAAGHRHCLVLVDGFYEWQEVKGRNYPYYIRLKNHEPFALAGLWETWTNKKAESEVKTFTVITTQANSLMAKIHNKKKRMPVILPKKDEQSWIKQDLDIDGAKQLLVPFDETVMEAYTISRLITANDVDPNVPEVMEPYNYSELETAQEQATLF
jgi:putative SOS response-associated peptidase YedK